MSLCTGNISHVMFWCLSPKSCQTSCQTLLWCHIVVLYKFFWWSTRTVSTIGHCDTTALFQFVWCLFGDRHQNLMRLRCLSEPDHKINYYVLYNICNIYYPQCIFQGDIGKHDVYWIICKMTCFACVAVCFILDAIFQ